MNRQFRRAQERQDKKQEKDKARRRGQRRQKIQQARRGTKKNDDKGPTRSRPKGDARPGKRSGRFALVFAVLTAWLVSLSAVAPPEEGSQLIPPIVLSLGLYLMFGYFLCLWLMRRGVDRALWLAVGLGAMLALGSELGKLLQPDFAVSYLVLGLSFPLLFAGAWLGRLVYVNAPN